MRVAFFLAFAVAAALLAPATARAQLAEFYLGVDGLSQIAAGVYGGLPNPNFNRLTLLYNHGNHYHALGPHSYSGPNLGGATLVVDTNGNNRIPEISASLPPLTLVAGSGAYAGKLVSAPQAGVAYSDLELRNVHSLDGSPDDVLGLFGSSGGRWSGPLWNELSHAHIHLELVSATPGLHVGMLTNPDALSIGGDVHVGDGDELFAFSPVLWTESQATPGVYSAEFRLVDENGIFGDSGRFFIDVQVVPEPSSLVMAGLGGLGMIALLRRRRATAQR